MSTYPDDWPTGTVMGRNLVPHPKFPAGITTKGAWTEGGAVADREGAYAGARALATSKGPRITLDGLTVAEHAGQEVTVTVQTMGTINAVRCQVILTGTGGSPTGAGGHNLVMESVVTKDGDYHWHTFTLELPAPPFRNDRGSTIEPTTYDLIISGAPDNQTGVAAARVDFAGSPVGDANGYLDGDLDLTPDFDAAWDTPPAEDTFATTTATALTGAEPDPDPEDPDPEDPDPEDPDPEDPDPEDPDPEDPDPEDPDPEDPDPEDPDPEDPDPEDPDPDDDAEIAALVVALSPTVAAFVGRPGDTTTEAQAGAALPVVLDFVRAYTRGNGFTGYRPDYPLRSVLISATARLVTNPEQVRQYQIADYSESPAVLNGYTLAELGLLRRYRRTQA